MLRKNLRKPAVLEIFGIGTNTLDDLVSRKQFPPPHKIVKGARAVGWFEDELVALQRGHWHPGWTPDNTSRAA
jgi:predicted DNA-binding transcriptional regulator AlpA